MFFPLTLKMYKFFSHGLEFLISPVINWWFSVILLVHKNRHPIKLTTIQNPWSEISEINWSLFQILTSKFSQKLSPNKILSKIQILFIKEHSLLGFVVLYSQEYLEKNLPSTLISLHMYKKTTTIFQILEKKKKSLRIVS